MHLLTFLQMLVMEARAESLVIHEYNRAQILLINAVATKFSGVNHFQMSGQSCTYYVDVYSPVFPKVLNLVHINHDYLERKEHIQWFLND